MNVEIKFYNATFGEELKDKINDNNISTTIESDELTDVQIIQEIDLLSEYLAENVCDLTLINKTDKVLQLKTGQVGKVYYYNNYMATVVIEDIKRTGEYEYKVTCTDYIGALDNMTFAGFVWLTWDTWADGQNAYDKLDSVLSQTGIPYYISPDLKNTSFKGLIPNCTVREALGEICFVCGAVATTANSDKLKIYRLSDSVSQHIPKNKVRQTPAFSNSPPPLAVNLAYYRISNGEETTLYVTSSRDVGNIKYYETSKPYWGYYSGGEILERGPYYTKVKVSAPGVSFFASPVNTYQYVKSKENSDVSAVGVVEIKDLRIVTSDNVNDILDRCFNYYMKSNTVTLSIYENSYSEEFVKYGQTTYGDAVYGEKIPAEDKVELGETITVNAGYMGEITGIVKSIRFNLNSNRIVKECEIIY